MSDTGQTAILTGHKAPTDRGHTAEIAHTPWMGWYRVYCPTCGSVGQRYESYTDAHGVAREHARLYQ